MVSSWVKLAPQLSMALPMNSATIHIRPVKSPSMMNLSMASLMSHGTATWVAVKTSIEMTARETRPLLGVMYGTIRATTR